MVAASLALGYAVAFDGIHTRLAPQLPPTDTSFLSRGPFSGKQVGDCWLADEPKSHFNAGEVVIWQMRAELRPDATAIVGTELWCGDRLVQIDERKVAPAKLQAQWMSFGIRIPHDVTGECRLQRQIQVGNGADATMQEYDLRKPVSFVVNPQ